MNAKTLIKASASALALAMSFVANAGCMKYPAPAENRSGAIGAELDRRGVPASLGGEEHPCLPIEKPDPVIGKGKPRPTKPHPVTVVRSTPESVDPATLQLCKKAPNSPKCR